MSPRNCTSLSNYLSATHKYKIVIKDILRCNVVGSGRIKARPCFKKLCINVMYLVLQNFPRNNIIIKLKVLSNPKKEK